MDDQTRQFGENLSKIRPDHVNRYMFAAERIQKKSVIDLACGCGYGSWILHGSGNKVTGIDAEKAAIEYAHRFYPGPEYLQGFAEEVSGEWDAVVSFETIEHLKDPLSVLKKVRGKQIIASVPNEELYPFDPEKFKDDAYPHLRHYTPVEFESLLNDAGYTVTDRFCQKDKFGAIEPFTEGIFLIYIGEAS